MARDLDDGEECVRVRAVIERTNREPLEAYLFLRPGQRASDLLNDRREFLPAAALDGRFVLIAKKSIEEIEPREEGAAFEEEELEDPYETLGVDEDATLQEVVTVYKSRLKRLHPDAVRAAGLDNELIAAADSLTKQLNEAYQSIRRRLSPEANYTPRRR